MIIKALCKILNSCGLVGLVVLLQGVAVVALGQPTLKVMAVPASTPATAKIYVAGSFNNWNPAASALTKNADGSYQITLPAGSGNAEYKFTRGSWESVEVEADGKDVANRRFSYGNTAIIPQQIANWADMAGRKPPKQHTVTANVAVVADSFRIPQLNRTRRIWIYLPNDYTAGTRRYPVLYVHDGQNVFDDFTSFSGEWGIDETLRQLQQTGQDQGTIVVAVDNGGSSRLDELSPWRNPQYGGGEGDRYVDFMAHTLKPYIDAHYRTLSGREFTGIAGSSMGGLISLYAALKYPAVYSKAGIFSPAFWFAKDSLFQFVASTKPVPTTSFYFVAATPESETMVPLMAALRDSLQKRGFPAANMTYRATPDGQHAEWFWKREFPAAYQWLYAPTAAGHPSALAYSAYAGSNNELVMQLPESVRTARLELKDPQGRTVLKKRVHANESIDLSKLAQGTYALRIRAGKLTGNQEYINY
ncbi:alpha/beta hydrolase-fold protein [Hymenobacter sp. BT491]|uniref:alpha/beta hydrolase-fold protein n=1 Tax=Hymenobacter sp. BT491 TaxID=2766779 RepID=UPI001653CE8A|nr:alpha/beta hydrolase-fold protein [Hymenobacter sp. BT491]MBC6989100.1 alpha/beta hydrolase [Hymenobacter sp. BT491]